MRRRKKTPGELKLIESLKGPDDIQHFLQALNETGVTDLNFEVDHRGNLFHYVICIDRPNIANFIFSMRDDVNIDIEEGNYFGVMPIVYAVQDDIFLELTKNLLAASSDKETAFKEALRVAEMFAYKKENKETLRYLKGLSKKGK